MTTRQLPRWRDLSPLVKMRRPVLSPTRRRLQAAQTIADLRVLARSRTPRSVFDYTDGAAEAELTLARSRELFAGLEFRPSVLRDVSRVDVSTTMLGRRCALPFAFAPTGFTRMMHSQGESAVARVAQRADVPYALSTLGTTSIEDVADVAPDAAKWFQLYVWKDRDAGAELVRRAHDRGYEALILTVDAPVAGARLRDARNGFTIPPTLTPRTMLDLARKPRWWADLLTTPPLTFASLTSWDGTVAELMNTLFDPSMTIDDLAWLRSLWSGPLIVKGVQTADDARRMADAGADAVVISNHGGRQLDRAPTPLRELPDVVDAVGEHVEVYVDTGVMSGADIVAALALGARGVLVGRAYLYGLMAGGEPGVQRAVDILGAEVRRTMQLLGAASVADLHRGHVLLPHDVRRERSLI